MSPRVGRYDQPTKLFLTHVCWFFMNSKTILLWCREPSWCKGLSPAPFGDHVSLVPTYCFDPREFELFADNQSHQSYRCETLKGVEQLRQDLVARGSNLLVSNGHYEKVIPSIARVLQVDEVVTFLNTDPQIGVFENLMSFRAESLSQVSFQLNMHSIGFRMLDLKDFKAYTAPALPPFPKINPGRIPSAA